MCHSEWKKIRDTRRWLCARGKHTATCDRVANFYLYFNYLTMSSIVSNIEKRAKMVNIFRKIRDTVAGGSVLASGAQPPAMSRIFFRLSVCNSFTCLPPHHYNLICKNQTGLSEERKITVDWTIVHQTGLRLIQWISCKIFGTDVSEGMSNLWGAYAGVLGFGRNVQVLGILCK